MSGLSLGAGLALSNAKSLFAQGSAPANPFQVYATNNGSGKRSLRFAHMTDIHIMNARNSEAGLHAALQHIHGLHDTPELIVTSGDNINDALGATRDSAKWQFDTVTRIMAQNCTIPYQFGIGNHDIWGWHPNSKTTGTEPGYGKKWAVDVYNLPNDYYEFEKGGWKFVVLDSIRRADRDIQGFERSTYMCALEGEQREWLKGVLDANARTKTPVVFLSHCPILLSTSLSSMNLLAKKAGKSTPFGKAGQDFHMDCYEIVDLFSNYPNVKLCLSGHTHVLNYVQQNGVSYINGGAVSAAWWKGPREGVQEGYGVIDLFDDGTFKYSYMDYGWEVG